MGKNSAKYNARLLLDLLKQHGCRHLVVAPGSRNAPLIVALGAHDEYETYSVPDERAAAFTALGMALETGKPAAVLCTSGSAAANFLPAVTEAYYQRVPLVLITADRPEEWVGQGAGQTIDQKHIFGKHVLAEANLLREPADELAQSYNARLVNEAMIAAKSGPVHINVPFEEPLYDKVEVAGDNFKFFERLTPKSKISSPELTTLKDIWNRSPKIWLLMGQMNEASQLGQILDQLNDKSAFLPWSETLSNVDCNYNISCIDRLLNTIGEDEKEELAPDLLITIGGEVVSKMVKKYLQAYPPAYHWHLSEMAHVKDTFDALTHIIPVSPYTFFRQLSGEVQPKSTDWRNYWHLRHQKRAQEHQQVVEQSPYSDLTVFNQILEALPEDSILHCANSASVRYSQLFDHNKGVRHFANRGTSGIDGSTSTAVGHASLTSKTLTLVTGDVAFLYDSAAFWNDRLPANLKIIVLNNSGGNIFRIIKGPANIEHFERFQETHHQAKLKGVAQTFNLPFTRVEAPESVPQKLKELYDKPGLSILEIVTPRLESPKVLAQYFKDLKD